MPAKKLSLFVLSFVLLGGLFLWFNVETANAGCCTIDTGGIPHCSGGCFTNSQCDTAEDCLVGGGWTCPAGTHLEMSSPPQYYTNSKGGYCFYKTGCIPPIPGDWNESSGASAGCRVPGDYSCGDGQSFCQSCSCVPDSTCSTKAPTNPSVGRFAANLTMLSTILSWSGGSGGTARLIRIGENKTEVETGCPGGVGIRLGCIVAQSLSTTTQSFDTGYILKPNTTYYWRVAEFKDSNDWMDFGGVCKTASSVNFQTQGIPPTATLTSIPTLAPVAQCQDIKIYNSSWSLLTSTQISNLIAGNQINFCVRGSVTPVTGSFDRARFTINGLLYKDTITIRPGTTNEFCQKYYIPVGTYNFRTVGEIHHTTLGWK